MKNLSSLVSRFRSAVPNLERKIQIALTGAATTFLAISQISWPGKLVVIGTAAGYVSATCAGMALLIQFTEDTARKIAEIPAAQPPISSSPITPDSSTLKLNDNGQLDHTNPNAAP